MICGSMFSGKTEELIRRLRRAQFANQKVEIYKPAIDVRYSDDQVVSHDLHSIPSTPIDSPASMLLLSSDVEVVGIDEARALAEQYAWDRATTEGVYVLRNGQRVQMLFEGDAMYSEPAREIDEKFQFENNLVDSYYVYRIEIKGFDSVNRYEWEYEIDVNSKTGTCTVHKTEVEYEDDYQRY